MPLPSALMDTFARFAQPWLDRAARIGADPRDDDDVRFRRALLVLVSILILPISARMGRDLSRPGRHGGPHRLAVPDHLGRLDRDLLAHAGHGVAAPCSADEHPARADDLDGVRGRIRRFGCCGHMGPPCPARGPHLRWRASGCALVRRVRRHVPRLRHRRGAVRRRSLVPAGLVREHDDRAQRDRRGHGRLHAPGAVRPPARRSARGIAHRAGPGREPAAQHPPPRDRRTAQGRHRDDRRPVRRGVDPVRGRRRLHA